MTIKLRHYTDQPGFTGDFFKVRDFLLRIHRYGYEDRNWLWARWEYMFSHPALDEEHLSRIGVWEDDGKIVGLANYEGSLGEAYFSLDGAYSFLKAEMLQYAIEHLASVKEGGSRILRIPVPDNDDEFAKIAGECGFTPTDRYDPMSEYRISEPFPDITPPEGFSIVSLAEENDLGKINRALWRGFNHPGEPPDHDIPGRLRMQSGPDFRKDLTLVVKAPNGDYASFCGMWFLPDTDYALVEPVATDPAYRRLGLGRAAVLEGIRRCALEGAKVAYVGSAQQFYLSIGFRLLFKCQWWEYR